MDFPIRDLEDRAIMSLGPLFCSLARGRAMVYIGLFAGKLPVASPLLRSHLPLPFSVLPDLPQWLLQPAHHPSLLLYPSVRFCMHQNLDPSFPALQTLKCCSGLCLRRALCRKMLSGRSSWPAIAFLLQISTSQRRASQTSLGGGGREEKDSND